MGPVHTVSERKQLIEKYINLPSFFLFVYLFMYSFVYLFMMQINV